AICIGVRDLTKLYVFKSVILSASAVAFGYLSSLFINSLFTRNISLYMGTTPKSAIFLGIPLLASLCIFLMVVCYSLFILRKFRDISAVVALRTGHGSEKRDRKSVV